MDRAASVPGVLQFVSGLNLSITISKDMMGDLVKAVRDMTSKEVLVGFPESEAKERHDDDGNPVPITNAAIAYVQNTGEPALNIPARPFMVEGIENVQEGIVDRMAQIAQAALDGDSQRVDQGFHAAGIEAKLGIQTKIQDGPFEPLAESTLKARAARGRKGAQEELDRREAGEEPGVELARPLVDTGQLRSAVNYAVRNK
jgi:hypothetical protein